MHSAFAQYVSYCVLGVERLAPEESISSVSDQKFERVVGCSVYHISTRMLVCKKRLLPAIFQAKMARLLKQRLFNILLLMNKGTLQPFIIKTAQLSCYDTQLQFEISKRGKGVQSRGSLFFCPLGQPTAGSLSFLLCKGAYT